MKILMLSCYRFRLFSFLILGLVSPLLLTQCKSTGGTYKDVEYDPAKLKTPSGHGLQKKEYPFDDDGQYRKDWVKTNATGHTRSASKLPESSPAAPASLAATTEVASAGSTGGYYGPTDFGVPESASETVEIASAMPPSAPPVAAAPAAEYHKVASGDTLYSLSRRYSTSVDELKRVNGLSGDSIRVGQSLRLP